MTHIHTHIRWSVCICVTCHVCNLSFLELAKDPYQTVVIVWKVGKQNYWHLDSFMAKKAIHRNQILCGLIPSYFLERLNYNVQACAALNIICSKIWQWLANLLVSLYSLHHVLHNRFRKQTVCDLHIQYSERMHVRNSIVVMWYFQLAWIFIDITLENETAFLSFFILLSQRIETSMP